MLQNAQIVGFAEGTPILMADGTWRPIEKVKQGDMVMSFDPSKDDNALEPKKVVETYSTIHRDCIELNVNGKITVVAKDQLLFTPGAGWLPGFETKKVVGYDGSYRDLQVRRVRGGKFKIYDVTVDETHSLIANDLRVHNRKKRKPPPQPVVTAGKPGKPVSVTTVTNGQVTTVIVNPSPGSSGQVSVGASGNISVRQTNVPGLPVSDYVVYQPTVFLPYPGGSYVHDRALNAEIIRNSVCGTMLDKGINYRVTKADETAWEAEINNMISELNSIKSIKVPASPVQLRSGGRIVIKQDSTTINDAINYANALKREIRAGKKLTRGIIQQNCDKIASIINRVRNGVPDVSNPVVIIPGTPPSRPIVVCPSGSNYHSDRIYETESNYSYMTRVGNTCTYVFDPPNAPANTRIRYYKHWDPTANRYYYDRVSSNAFCSTAGGNTQA